jgi:hypothetical protein
MSIVVPGRWYWTNDRADLVPEGHPDAAFLAYPAGEEIPDEEARLSGLAAKLQAPTQDKMLRPTKTK